MPFPDGIPSDIRKWSFPYVFKQLAQIIRGKVKLIRYFFDRNFFGIIQLYVVCRLLYKQIWDLSGIFLFFLFSAQLFSVSSRTHISSLGFVGFVR